MFFSLESLDEKVVFSYTLNVKMKKCCVCMNIMSTLPVSVSVRAEATRRKKTSLSE